MTNPQAVTPTDEKLERLIEELSQAVGIAEWADPLCTLPCCESRRENAAAARAALREYVSEDTRRLDWLDRRYAEGEGFRVTVLEQMTLSARGAIDAAMKGTYTIKAGGASSAVLTDPANLAGVRRASMKEHPDK